MEKNRIKNETIWLTLLLILFVKNIVKFFAEGGDKSRIALILLNLIVIIALITRILNREKIDEHLLKQTKLDKYFINKKKV